MKILAEGAEAIVYGTELGGIAALLKRRMQKRYRIKEMDTKIRTARSRNEARIIAEVSKAGINSPRLLLFDGYDIYMTKIGGEKLNQILDSGKTNTRLFEEIGVMLGRLHNADVAHGDYTPANIIVGRDGPYVIDFGLSEITTSMEEKSLDVLLMKRSIAKSGYSSFITGYKRSSTRSKEVLERLAIVERRGRYQVRTLS